MRTLPIALGKRLISIPGLADYLEMPENAIRELIHGGGQSRLPAFKVGNRWFIDLEEVEDWLLEMLDKLEPFH
ncbi:MAG: helix-turn-helix domain-containing protein [Candidatus Binataceae bacterium]